MYFDKHSSYRICSYMLKLLILNLLTISVNCTSTHNLDECLTPGCKAATYLINHSIDEMQDPCHNFYNFACGSFKRSVKIRKNESEIGHLTLLSETVINNLAKVLTENIDPNEPKIFKTIKNYYNACVNSSNNINNTFSHFSDIISYLGGWPIIDWDSWDESKFDWMETLSKLRQVGNYPFYILTFNMVAYGNYYIPEIRTGYIRVKPEILQAGWKSTKYQSYVKYIVDVAVLLGAKNIQQAFYDAFQIIEFERRLSEFASDDRINVQRFDEIPRNVKYLDGTPVPQISWLNYVNKMTLPIINYTDNDIVQVSAPEYLMSLPSILQDVGRRTVANYIIWRAIDDLAPHLSTEIRELHDNFHGIHSSKQQQCLKHLLDPLQGLPIATDALYYKKYVNKEIINDVKQLIKYMGDQLTSYITKLKWIDETTKNEALTKVRQMNNIIGFPHELYDAIIMDNYHSNLDIDSNNHLQNVLNMKRFNLYHYFSKLTSSVFTYNLSNMFHKSFIEVNAYYYRNNNEIYLNAAMLHSPLYTLDWPNYMKFGALGHVIGHEMMHAFDNLSIFYDVNEYRRNYTNETISKYQDKMKCFVHQYGKYLNKQVNLTVDGSRTLNENLADYGGTMLAYSGYKQWIEEHGEESRLPGLYYTPEQIFWIMSAQAQCRKSNKEYQSQIMTNDVHTLDKFRVFGIVKNSIDFAKDFNCPVGSRMNPKKKCNLAK